MKYPLNIYTYVFVFELAGLRASRGYFECRNLLYALRKLRKKEQAG